jgi:hypothetical protein
MDVGRKRRRRIRTTVLTVTKENDMSDSLFTIMVLNLLWMAGLTIYVVIMKQGPRGPQGEKGNAGSSRYGCLSTYEVKSPVMELIDDAEYITKLIQRINAYQLHPGNKVDETNHRGE